MVDCYMALNVPYAIRLAELARPLNILVGGGAVARGQRRLPRDPPRAPDLTWTTAEHEYTRYGFRQLIAERLVDILQPDVMWVGGLTETLRIAAHAAAYDTQVIPHGSGPYSYHFIASQTGPAFCEYVAASPDGRSIHPSSAISSSANPCPSRAG
jgi:L-rhamnonate dehydratase